MKCILSSARRAISGRWFFIATFAALATMWLSVGNATYTLMDNLYMGSVPDWAVLLSKACLGQFGMLTLPALSAMPFASRALHELRSGVARFAIFRTGRKPYIAGQIVACIFSAMTMQAAAFALLITALSIVALHAGVGGIPVEAVRAVIPIFGGRMICAGLWTVIGCMLALLTETGSAAAIAPLCLCYTLTMCIEEMCA